MREVVKSNERTEMIGTRRSWEVKIGDRGEEIGGGGRGDGGGGGGHEESPLIAQDGRDGIEGSVPQRLFPQRDLHGR